MRYDDDAIRAIAEQLMELVELRVKGQELSPKTELTVTDNESHDDGLRIIGLFYAGVKSPGSDSGVKSTIVKWVSSRCKGDRSPAHPKGNPKNEHTFVVL